MGVSAESPYTGRSAVTLPERRRVDAHVGERQEGVQGVQVLHEADDIATEGTQHVVVAKTQTVLDEEVTELLQHLIKGLI